MGRENMLAYTRVGNQKSEMTLVFLHGSTMTKEGLLPFAKEFQDYNCIVFDLTAHGQSKEEEPDSISTFAEDVEYSLRQLQQRKEASEQIILLGYSMGGAITCEIAIRKNIGLAGIVILSSGGNLKNYTPLIDELKNMPADQFKTEDILGGLFGGCTTEDEVKRISGLFASTKAADVIGYGDLMLSNGYENLEACSQIKVPALMVHGSDDQIVLPGAAVETWKVIPDSELLVIPYMGHAAIYEDTYLIRDKIDSFIKKC